MTVIEEYDDLIRRFEKIKDWQDPWNRPYPLMNFAMHDAIKAITELAERCQIAEQRAIEAEQARIVGYSLMHPA